MTKDYIALVRHGDYQQQADTPSALQPYPLTAVGEQQARAGAEQLLAFLQSHQVQVATPIHCSVLLRAWQTASIMAETLSAAHAQPGASSEHLQLYQTAQLTERCVGGFANLTTAEIEAALAADPRHQAPPAGWKSNSHFQLPSPGAESLMMAGERVADYLCEAILNPACELRRHDPDAASQLYLVVGHGASIRHAAYQLGILGFSEIAKYSMHHAQPVIFSFDSDGRFEHVGGEWKLRRKSTEYTD